MRARFLYAIRAVVLVSGAGLFAVWQPETYEDPNLVTAEQRAEKYGFPGHVRCYGWKDFADRLTQAGFQVTIERFGHELTETAIREFALDRDERIYLVRKPLQQAR